MLNRKTSTGLSIIRFLAHRRSLFYLLRLYEWWLQKKFPKPNLSQTSYQVTIRAIRQLYSHSQPIIWTNLFFPCEFIYAAGAIPFYPEITAGLIAALGFSNISLELAEKKWYSQDLCSYHRAAIGMSISEIFPKPDFFLATTSICRSTACFFQTLSDIWNIPCYLIDVPFQSSPEATNYIQEQLESAASEIQSRLQCRFSWNETFSLSNQTVHIIRQIEASRKKPNVCIQPPTKNLEYLPFYYQFLGTPASLHFFEKLLDQIHQSNQNPNPKSGHRLLWLHLKPFYPNRLAALLEQYHFTVVYDEYASVYWELLHPENPFQSLAYKISSSQNLTLPQPRIAKILELCEQYKVDGVIQFNQWGCRQSQGMNYILKKTLQENGYPLLLLDGDHVDKRFYSEEQLRTRIEAFYEMLEGYE